LQTCDAMARIVREDRLHPDLRIFVLREIVGDISGHDPAGQIFRIFDFAQSRIAYNRDPFNVERVADIWSTMYALDPKRPEGDCGIKSTFFASCCALLGHKPFFVLIKQDKRMRAFNHVYCAVMVEGKLRFFDPTPEDRPAGWEAGHYRKLLYPIF
jgi:hypothetical protein